MINTVQRGDVLTMVGPDDARSAPFVLQEVPWTDGEFIWILRCDNAPIVVPHEYGVESRFKLHSRPRWVADERADPASHPREPPGPDTN